MVVCALSAGLRVSLDTERIGELRIESFHRFLNPRERAWIGEDRQRFFELWTQKEAVVKGHGEGGIVNLKRVNIECGDAIIDSQAWTLHKLSIDPSYATHMAIEGHKARPLVEVEYIAIAE